MSNGIRFYSSLIAMKYLGKNFPWGNGTVIVFLGEKWNYQVESENGVKILSN